MFLLVGPSKWQASGSGTCAGGMTSAWQLLRREPPPDVLTAEMHWACWSGLCRQDVAWSQS